MCYFDNAFRHPETTINTICHALNDPKFGDIHFIVGAGLSGTIVLLPVSIKSNIPCGAVRRMIELDTSSKNGGSHSASLIETCSSIRHKDVRRYVIVDDLIDDGETIKRIQHAMTCRFKHSECVGIILYNNSTGDPTKIGPNWKDIPITYLCRDIIEQTELIEVEQTF